MSIPILLYHRIATEATPRLRPWTVHPERFAAHMQLLHDDGYVPLTVTQVAQAIAAGSTLPERPVAITFDDGFADFLSALTVLQRLGFPATLFVATGYVGSTSRWLSREGESQRPMLTWAQLAEIAALGVECGGHSHHHVQLDVVSRTVAREEIARCRDELQQHLGRPAASFAYPHGWYDAAVRRMVQEAGFTAACAVKQALSAVWDDPFALSRIIVSPETDDAALRRLLAGHGMRVAPQRERMRTTAWRFARRVAAFSRGL